MSVDFKAKFSGSAETFSATMSEAPAGMTASMKETGGGTASNYQTLRNKPRINGVELSGDLTAEELGITSDQHYTHKQAQAAKVCMLGGVEKPSSLANRTSDRPICFHCTIYC